MFMTNLCVHGLRERVKVCIKIVPVFYGNWRGLPDSAGGSRQFLLADKPSLERARLLRA